MLKIDNIHTFYGNIEALKGISLEVNEGEIVALIGANGAGKTTMLMAISGFIKIKSGSIEFMSKRLSGLMPEDIVSLGISHVPEGRRIFPMLTVMENLDMGAYSRKDTQGIRDDMERTLALFPILKQRIKQYGGTLSGGEQQMLAIGRALMARPRLLLLDEPSLGLAPKLVESIFQIIKEINQKQGVTLLLVEQDAYAALKVANRGYVMETGKIVMMDTAANLLKNDEVKNAYLGGGN
ncbi:MAG: ABC transporter ATP-binding protein [Candidatus Desantisbacteria bacterium]